MKLIETLNAHIEKKVPFYSLEFFPPKEKQNWPLFFETVRALHILNPVFASVTYGAGGSTQDNTLEIAAGLFEEKLTPMAHLTCVGATSEGISVYLNRLKAAGVTNILALRGDAPANDDTFFWENGQFVYASDLVHFVRTNFPEFGVSVAAYSTPHPESLSFNADREATLQKMNACDFGVTQLFFDPREYFEYVRQMRKLGMAKPILPGVLPVQSLDSMKRILSLSGCNIPAKLYLSLEKAHEKGGSAAVAEAGIAFAIEQIRQLINGGAPGVHLYTLNKADLCLRIAEGVGSLT